MKTSKHAQRRFSTDKMDCVLHGGPSIHFSMNHLKTNTGTVELSLCNSTVPCSKIVHEHHARLFLSLKASLGHLLNGQCFYLPACLSVCVSSLAVHRMQYLRCHPQGMAGWVICIPYRNWSGLRWWWCGCGKLFDQLTRHLEQWRASEIRDVARGSETRHTSGEHTASVRQWHATEAATRNMM